MWTMNFQMFKLVLEKAEGPEIKLPTYIWSSKKQESFRKTSISALLTMPKPLTVWITINCGKFLKRWQEYIEELYKKDLHDPNNHKDVITQLEPDILKCEVKWALGSITMNKASGGDGIPVELFKILKDDAVKVLHSICQQIWKLSNGHRTGKGQYSFQSQRKTMPKNTQTTAQLPWSHTLLK